MSAGFTTITASKIQDASGHLLASGRVVFSPCDANGNAVSAVASAGGMITTQPVPFLVVAGQITTDIYGDTPQVADTALTSPALFYQISVIDPAGRAIQGPGYNLVQPTGSTWSLDTYVPIPIYVLTVSGGTLTLTQTSGVSSTVSTVVFADTAVPGAQYVLSVANCALTLASE